MVHTIRTIDAHAAGEPLRLIVDGLPLPEGGTMLEKRAWAAKRLDHYRRALMLEPRGHGDMYGALLTEPVTADGDAGVLFMHNEGWSTMCGHGIIALTTIALERGLITGSSDEIRFDTPAGRVVARAEAAGQAGGRPRTVSFVNVPSFVFEAGLPVPITQPGAVVAAPVRMLRVDIAFGGAFYAIVDAESAGVPILPARLPEIRALGMTIAREVERLRRVSHPDDEGLTGVYGTIFTGPPQGEADLRNVTVFADAEVDRSPCGTGTAAVMAVLSEMGVLLDDAPFVHESIVGTTFTGRVVRRTRVGEREAIVPSIEGSAWITGEHAFYIDGDDPLRAGFRL